MKVLLNWRYYVIAALFAIGFLAIARLFGEPTEPMTDAEWLMQSAISLSVGVPCFYTLFRLIKQWELKGNITIHYNEYNDGN